MQLSTRRCKLGHDARAPAAALQLQGGALSSLHNLQVIPCWVNFRMKPGLWFTAAYWDLCYDDVNTPLTQCQLHVTLTP